MSTNEITYRGVTKTLEEWAHEIGISRLALHSRLETMTFEQAMHIRPHQQFAGHALKLAHNGAEKTIREWSSEIGVPEGTIYTRWRDGKSMAEVLSPKPLERKARGGGWEGLETLEWERDTYAQELVARHPGGMKLDEMAREMGITRERIRQIEAAALRKLRFALSLRGSIRHALAERMNLPSSEMVRDALDALTDLRNRQTVTYPEPCELPMSPKRKAALKKRADAFRSVEQSGLIQRPENEQGEREAGAA